MTTTKSLVCIEKVANAILEKNRRTIVLPTEMEIEVEIRVDTDGYIDFYTTSLDVENIKVKPNWLGTELLFMEGHHITGIDEESCQKILDHIATVKPLGRKLKEVEKVEFIIKSVQC